VPTFHTMFEPDDVDMASDTEFEALSDIDLGSEGDLFDDEEQTMPRDAPIYKHEPFDLDRPGFRLMRLLPRRSALIECEIFQAWVDERENAITYEALSYTWGDPNDMMDISIDGKRHSVTWNLWNALNHLRHKNSARVLWADAACIDQHNNQERGHQVHLMAEIYSRASNVIFWLGSATEETNFLMASLERLQHASMDLVSNNWTATDERWTFLWKQLATSLQRNKHTRDHGGTRWTFFWEQIDQSLRDKDPDREYYLRTTRTHSFLEELNNHLHAALKDVFSRSWWKRVWILQEVAKAKAAVIAIGQMSIPARIFSLAPFIFKFNPDQHCQAILQIMPSRARGDSWYSVQQDLWTMMRKFPDSQATERRDLIYALLGISSDPRAESSLQPNYDRSEADIIDDLVKYWLPGFTNVADILIKGKIECSDLKSFTQNATKLWNFAPEYVAQYESSTVLQAYLRNYTPNTDSLLLMFKSAAKNESHVEEMMGCLLRYHQEHHELAFDLSKNFFSIFSVDYKFRAPQVTTASVLLQNQGNTINSIMTEMITVAKDDLNKAERIMSVLLDSQPEVRLSQKSFFTIIENLPATTFHVLNTRLHELGFDTDEFEQELLNERLQRKYQRLGIFQDGSELFSLPPYIRIHQTLELLLLSGNQYAVQKELTRRFIPELHDAYSVVISKIYDRLKFLTSLWENGDRSTNRLEHISGIIRLLLGSQNETMVADTRSFCKNAGIYSSYTAALLQLDSSAEIMFVMKESPEVCELVRSILRRGFHMAFYKAWELDRITAVTLASLRKNVDYATLPLKLIEVILKANWKAYTRDSITSSSRAEFLAIWLCNDLSRPRFDVEYTNAFMAYFKAIGIPPNVLFRGP
jgi:hypothetical protein